MSESHGGNDLLVKISADASEFNTSVEGLSEHVIDFVKNINPVVGLAVTAIAGIGLAALEAGEKFEEAFLNMEANTGAEGQKLEDMKQAFDDVFQNAPVSTENLGNAIVTFSTKLDLSGKALADLTLQVTNFADISGSDLNAMVQSTAKSFGAWKISTEDQSTALDYLNRVHQKTGISVVEMQNQLASAQPILKQYGLSWEQSATLMGQASKAGIDWGTVQSGLSKGLVTLANSGVDAHGALQGIIEGIKGAGTESASNKIAIDDFGKSGTRLAEAIREGKISLDDAAVSANRYGKTINEIDDKTDSTSEKFDVLKQRVESLLAPMGGALVTSTAKFLDVLTNVWDVVSGVPGALDKTKEAFMDFGLVIYKAGTFLEKFTMIGGIFEVASKLPGVGFAFKAVQNEITAALSGGDDMMKKALVTMTAHNQAMADSALGAQKVTTSQKDVQKAIEDGKNAQENAKALLAEYAKIAGALSEDRKTLYIPAILDETTASSKLDDARQVLLASETALQSLQARSKGILDESGASSDKYALSIKGVSLAIEKNKEALEAYKEAEKQNQLSKSVSAKLTADVQAAEDALASAAKSTHIPVILDHQMALQNIAKAQVAYQVAVENLRKAQMDALTVQLDESKTAEQVKEVTDRLSDAKKGLNAAVTALSQANKDETESTKVLSAAAAELDAGQSKLADTKKRLQQSTTDVAGSFADYQTKLQSVTAATVALQEAEDNLKVVRDNGASTGQQIVDATTKAKDARKALADADKDASESQQVLTQNFGLNADALKLVIDKTNGLSDAQRLLIIQESALGIQNHDVLAKMASDSEAFYKQISASGIASDSEIRQSHIKALEDRIAAEKQSGQTVTAQQQIELAQLKQQEEDYCKNSITRWSDLYKNIHDQVTGMFDSMVHTLFTGDGSFADAAVKALQGIGEAVAKNFTKPATDAIADFISGTISNLLSGDGLGGVMDSLTKIGKSITDIFTGGASAASSVASGAGSAAGAGSGVASGVAGAANGVVGIVGAIGSIGSMISGIIGNFQNARQENTLNAIEESTRYSALYLGKRSDQGILGQMFSLIDEVKFGYTTKAVESMNNLIGFQNAILQDISTHGAYIQPTLDYFGPYITAIPSKLDMIAMNPPMTNVSVNVTLDGNQIASYIETRIEQSIRLAIG